MNEETFIVDGLKFEHRLLRGRGELDIVESSFLDLALLFDNILLIKLLFDRSFLLLLIFVSHLGSCSTEG